MNPGWPRFTGNSNLPPFDSSSEPGPSQPRSRSRTEQWIGDQNVGYPYNLPHQQPGQGDLHMQPVGEMVRGYDQLVLDEPLNPFIYAEHRLRTASSQRGFLSAHGIPVIPPLRKGRYPKLSGPHFLLSLRFMLELTFTHQTDNLFYHYSPPHFPTITNPGSQLGYQGANIPQFHINPTSFFGETVQGSGSNAQLPAVPSYHPPQVPTFGTGFREGDATTSQIAQSLQSDIPFLDPLYSLGPVRYDSPYNRPMEASMDIQGAGPSSTAGNMSLFSPERADATVLYGDSTVRAPFAHRLRQV